MAVNKCPYVVKKSLDFKTRIWEKEALLKRYAEAGPPLETGPGPKRDRWLYLLGRGEEIKRRKA